MPIGDFQEHFYKNGLARFLLRAFGTPALHDQLRIAPLIRYFSQVFSRQKTVRVLEVGCGSGLNLFELGKLCQIKATGYDISPESIKEARKLAGTGTGSFQFQEADATTLAPRTERFDVLLLMDFLEHVPNPAQIVRRMTESLELGGLTFISVPTPLYPRVFGRKMHMRIGHLVDGYHVDELRALVPEDLEMIHSSYNTGFPIFLACALQYRVLERIPGPRVRWLLSVPLLLMKRLDWVNGRRFSCSLFAVFRKTSPRTVGM